MSGSSAPQFHAKRERPLSPHLQVYRLPMTARMSITHRATGAALAIGSLMVVWWLVAAATGEAAYNAAMEFAQSPLGMLALFGWSVALYYHAFNGVCHLIWDTGRLFKKENAKKAGYTVLLATVLCVAGTWYCVLAHDDSPSAQTVMDTLAGTFEKGAP